MTDARLRWRLRLLGCCVLLTGLAFVQSPGLVVNDTKFDLAVRPALFLEKVLHLWDPIGTFGQVQNQAYGYLFPMGPFFLAGDGLGVPAWVVQRAWWALVLVVAFLGVVKLCAVLDVGAPWARVVAAFAFALSPRMLTNLGPISIESWPSAIAPWVLVPLVVGMQRGSARRAAARSGLAAAFVGGVNAVASAAIVPMAALWLLTRRRGSRRGTMLRWWPVFMGLATLWWLVPLLVLGRYSPPFLDYIESARATTTPATIADALRGTTKWVPYVASDYTAGRTLLTQPVVILQTGLLVLVGLLGLVRRDLAERRVLLLSLMAGVFLVTMGHLGAVQGLLADPLSTQLDAVLAPLRNTHKWDVLIRLPLVIGVAHALSVVGTRVVEGRRQVRDDQLVLRGGVAVLVSAAVLGGGSVALSTSLASAGAFAETPDHWTQAAAWLEEHDDGRRTYVAPGSPFGDYTWGTPMDEAVQALVDAPWATRSVIPLVPGSNIRMMDAIESRLVNGRGSEGLHRYLSRAGIGHVLVRHDLRPTASVPRAARISAAIAATPGLVRVASFGPELGGDSRSDASGRPVFFDDGWQTRRPAIEIYRVEPGPGEGTEASTYRTSDLPVFVGDAETLLRALEMRVLDEQPVEFARDAALSRRPGSLLLTDGTRRQEVEYGRVHDNRSASHAVDEPWQTSRPVRDYDTGSAGRWLTTPRLEGVDALTATSSASNAEHPGEIDQSALAFSAVDGDPDTAWVSGPAVDGRHALTLRLSREVDVEQVRLAVPDAPRATQRTVTVTTDAGSRRTSIAPGDEKTVRTAPGPTRTVTVSATSDLGQPLRISGLDVPGVEVTRPLVLPAYPGTWGVPDAIALSVDAGERAGCLVVDGDTRCAEHAERLGEDGRTIDRVVRLPHAASFAPTLRVVPWGTDALTTLLQTDRLSVAAASSQVTHTAASGAFAAVDGDPTTGWVAAASDRDPSLTVSWLSDVRVSAIDVRTSPGLVGARPTGAVLDFGDGSSREVDLSDGRATFRPVTASRVTVRFTGVEDATNVDRDGQSGRTLSAGVSELSFPGTPLDTSPLSTEPLDLPCGTGPQIEVDGTVRSTALAASPAQLYDGAVTRVRVCDGTTVRLDEDESRVTVGPTDVVRPLSLLLDGPGSLPAAVPTAVRPGHPDAATTTVDLPNGPPDRLLLLRHNANTGWTASTDATAVTVDGWQQGWRVGGDAQDLRLHFAPDSVYRGGLLAGLVGLVVVALAALLPRFARSGVDQPPVGPAPFGWVVGSILVGGFAVLVAGVPGLVTWAVAWSVGSLGAVAETRGRRLAGTAVAAVVSVAVMTVYAAYAVRPWGGEHAWTGLAAWPQLLVVAAVSAAAAGAFVPRRSRLLSRIAGRSTR